MILNLKCEKCRTVYNFEVGKLSMNKIGTLVFENTNPFAQIVELLTKIY